MKLNKVYGKKPVIIQVLPNLGQGGVERGTLDASKAIVKAGGESIVISNGGPLVKEIMMAKGKHIQLPVHSKNIFIAFSTIKKIKKIIKEYDVDIVHARSRVPAWLCCFAVKKTKAKFVTTFHAAYKFKGRLKHFYNSIMTKGASVIAISEFIQDHILANYQVDKNKVHKVIRGVDLQKFSTNKINNKNIAEILDKNWGVPDGFQVVLCPGRLSKIKGQETLIYAANILKQRGVKDVAYVFLGSDQGRKEYQQSLLKKIKEYNLEDCFYMIERCDDMPSAYTIANVVVALSVIEEGFGRISTEAQAMGRPIIATNLGGYLETVLDGETGSLIEPNDPNALADELQKYLKLTHAQKTKLANVASKHVKENFSCDVMFNQLFTVYNDLLK